MGDSSLNHAVAAARSAARWLCLGDDSGLCASRHRCGDGLLVLLLCYLRWEAEGPKVVMNEIWLQLYRDLAISAAFLFRARAVASLPVRALFRRISFFFLLSGGSSFSYLLTWPTNAERAHWYDVAWCVPYLFVTAIASKSQEEDAVSVKKPASPLSIVVFSRVLPACVPLIVLLMSRRIAHEQVTLAWTAITASFLVSTARLMLTNEKQLRVADNLRRTEAALQQSSEMFTAA